MEISSVNTDASTEGNQRLELSHFPAPISKAPLGTVINIQQSIDRGNSFVDLGWNSDMSAGGHGSQTINNYPNLLPNIRGDNPLDMCDRSMSLDNNEYEEDTVMASDPKESDGYDMDDFLDVPPDLASEGADLSQYHSNSLLQKFRALTIEEPLPVSYISPTGDTSTLSDVGTMLTLASSQASISTMPTLPNAAHGLNNAPGQQASQVGQGSTVALESTMFQAKGSTNTRKSMPVRTDLELPSQLPSEPPIAPKRTYTSDEAFEILQTALKRLEVEQTANQKQLDRVKEAFELIQKPKPKSRIQQEYWSFMKHVEIFGGTELVTLCSVAYCPSMIFHLKRDVRSTLLNKITTIDMSRSTYLQFLTAQYSGQGLLNYRIYHW